MKRISLIAFSAFALSSIVYAGSACCPSSKDEKTASNPYTIHLQAQTSADSCSGEAKSDCSSKESCSTSASMAASAKPAGSCSDKESCSDKSGCSETDFASMLSSYFTIQQKLAADDFEGAHNAAMELSRNTGAAATTLGAAAPKMKGAATALVSAPDLSAARAAFLNVSDLFVAAVEKECASCTETVYLISCPMVKNDGTKAFWLQKDKNVANPYHGSGMLKCGKVEKQLTGNQLATAETPDTANIN